MATYLVGIRDAVQSPFAREDKPRSLVDLFKVYPFMRKKTPTQDRLELSFIPYCVHRVIMASLLHHFSNRPIMHFKQPLLRRGCLLFNRIHE
jgi:hypothetical protein